MKIFTENKEYPEIIFRNEPEGNRKFVTYNVSFGNKNEDGSYRNGSFEIAMPRDTDLPDKTKIIIKNAWFDIREYTDAEGNKKKTRPFIRCNDYEVVGDVEVSHIDADETEDLPF